MAGVYAVPLAVRHNDRSGLALVRWRMASPAEGLPMPWGAQTAWVPDPHMVAWFQNRAGLDPALESAARYLQASDSSTKPCLYPDTMSELAEFGGALENSRTPMVHEMVWRSYSNCSTLESLSRTR